jgi:hypothetical protein
MDACRVTKIEPHDKLIIGSEIGVMRKGVIEPYLGALPFALVSLFPYSIDVFDYAKRIPDDGCKIRPHLLFLPDLCYIGIGKQQHNSEILSAFDVLGDFLDLEPFEESIESGLLFQFLWLLSSCFGTFR